MSTRIEKFEICLADVIASADETPTHGEPELDGAMQQRVHLQGAFERLAERLHGQEIRPRMEAVARQLGGGRLEHVKTLVGSFSTYALPRTDRFAATATLILGITFDQASLSAAVSYSLQIIPVLMNVNGREDLPLQLEAPDIEGVVEWIERRLREFVASCLRIERSPEYRVGLSHVDPVCGMLVHVGPLVHTSAHGRQLVYFCSQTCKDKFEAKPGSYIDQEVVSAASEPAVAAG